MVIPGGPGVWADAAKRGWRSPFRDSIRLRLALWHTLTIAGLLVAFSIGTWIFFERTTRSRADQSLADMTRSFVRVWEGVRAEEETSAAAAAGPALREFRDHDRRLGVYDASGRLIALSDTAPLTPALHRLALADARGGPAGALIRNAVANDQSVATIESDGEDIPPIRAHAIRVVVDGQPFTILALRALRAEEEAAESFLAGLVVVIPSVLVLAGLGGYLLARASLAPVVAMGKQAERISAHNLEERLSAGNPRDELGSLAAVLNGLLARLHAAFQHEQQSAARQRQFMADASHELRTPVAAFSSVAQVALANPDRSPAELREALEIIQGEGHRLARLVDDLFLLSAADAGALPVRAEELFLEEVLQDSARSARGLAASRGLTFKSAPGEEAPFIGDTYLLRRLVMILLDNAIKYTPAGGEVRLSLERDDGARRYRIVVEDTGPGVPAEARERIFERFFRADIARSRESEESRRTGSAGLGLAIGRFLAELHGGSVELESTGPLGSRFVATLPMRDGVRVISEAASSRVTG